jgi:TonB-dependent receptor
MTRLTGRDWTNLANYNRDDPNPNNISTAERNGRSQIWTGGLDAKQTFHLGLPITVGAGIKSRLTVYDLWKTGSLTWTYIGPARNQLDPTTVMIPHTEPHLFDAKQGDNVDDIDIPIPNATAMYQLYQQHPEYFSENAFTNFSTLRTSPRAAKEQIDAGYVELNTRWQRLRLNVGVREERTRTIGRTFDLIPAAKIRATRPDLTPNTIPYLEYQYRGFEKFNKYGDYKNTFVSGGAKYSLLRNLVLQLSASQAIGRPDYNNLAGALTINDTNFTVRVPNPELKPETSNKVFASAQYYVEPAGTLTVSGYQLNLKNSGLGTEQISAEEAGLADDPAYAGYTFLRTSNAAGTRKIKGVEVEYSQQLVFLPGWMRGFSVFGSVSRAASDTVVTNLVPKAANGGIRFSNYKFNIQLRSTWSAARLTSTSATQRQWDYERLMFDLSGGYKLGQRYEITLSGRNITNTPIRGYINEPGLLRTNQEFGAVWTLGLRGRW